MNRSMEHVLFVVNSLGSGGAERVVSLLASELSRRSIRVSVVLRSNAGREIKQRIAPEVAVFDLADEASDLYRQAPRLLKTPWYWSLLLAVAPGKVRALVASMAAQSRLGSVIRHLNPDVAVAFMVSSNIKTTAALAGSTIPVVISERSDPRRYDDSPLRRWYRDRLYAKADGLVFQTRDAMEYFSRTIQARSAIIPNPLDLSPGLVRRQRTASGRRVVSVGRLVSSKRFDQLIRAVASLRAKGLSVSLEIYGEGPDGEALSALSRELLVENQVSFMGFRKDVLADILEADVFVLCSEYEGMPNALLEALGLGIPSVATDCPVGGPRSLIQNGVNGLLIPVADQVALEAALENLLLDQALAARFSAASVSIRDTLGTQRIADLWLAEFRAAAERKEKGLR